MDKKDITLIQELLKQCVESLSKGDLCPDYAVKLFVMARVNALAQQACKITGVNLSEGGMVRLRMYIIDTFGMKYSDCHGTDDVDLLPEVEYDSLFSACNILGMCCALAHMHETARLCTLVKASTGVFEFAESVSSLRLDYDDLVGEMYNIK